MKPFNDRFSSENQVKNSVKASLLQHEAGIREAESSAFNLRNLTDTGGSIISRNIKRIREADLLLMFRTVACFGLTQWAPNVLIYDPDSMYNLLHEHIALTTFEQIAGAYGYSFMGVNLTHVRNFSLMRQLYRSFVYSHMAGRARREQKAAGSIALLTERNNVYRRRADVSVYY